ncbi:HAD family hydrolase [Candidatus Thiosymbion oneisti]|uniref:HAD family hydrolase n=1 Tax=Candidatus Thiosymbion oneisti TaxID=589554 RepID=UPI00105D2707|nr:HAD-IA family hydrolase [Candidatus Thiosymbion oneisti]
MDKLPTERAFRLLTIDLDDTLWPCAPTIERAEAVLYAWLERTAPRLTEVYDQEAMRRHRRVLMMSRPEIAHDLTAVRRHSLRGLLSAYGYDMALADAAVALFLEHRNRVIPYADVLPALQALGAEYPLVSVTNGNAEVARTPLRGLFGRSLTAADVGARKPAPNLFLGALQWGRVPPERALHLGDDPYRDVEAARRLGMAAVWINRGDTPWPHELKPPAGEVADLGQLRCWLEDRQRAL